MPKILHIRGRSATVEYFFTIAETVSYDQPPYDGEGWCGNRVYEIADADGLSSITVDSDTNEITLQSLSDTEIG